MVSPDQFYTRFGGGEFEIVNEPECFSTIGGCKGGLLIYTESLSERKIYSFCDVINGYWEFTLIVTFSLILIIFSTFFETDFSLRIRFDGVSNFHRAIRRFPSLLILG